MDVAELVLKYVEALVWPSVVTALAWAFRRHLKRAFGRMTRLETPAGAIEFAEEAARTYEEVGSSGAIQTSGEVTIGRSSHIVVGHTQERGTGHARERDEVINQALELISTSPDSAVMIAWRAIETALRRVTPELSREHEGRPRFNARGSIDELRRRGLVSSDMANTMMDLHRLRSRVSHVQHSVLPDAALDYVASCELVLWHLESISEFGPAA
ncbi:hypothetical protein ACFUJU_31920 [Streptomyces sp. NPDC057235]|uniref:hypothetical protein n=1 Tax=Streptomyces sp. NPDC057235 TaxID=3346058 RepID=UPI0036419DF4